MPLTETSLDRMRATIEARFLDDVTITRPGSTVDSEGDVVGAPEEVATVRATIGTPRARDRETAASLGQRLDAVLYAPVDADVRLGDTVSTTDGSWTVITVDPQRFITRAQLRRVE